MKKQFFINANIIDPYNSLNEGGGLIADRAYVIEEGAIAISGLSKDLLKNAELKRSYLGL